MSIKAIPTDGGGHDIVTDTYVDGTGQPLVLVRVRPVGTLQWGDLSMFVSAWVPELIEALTLAGQIGNQKRFRP